MPRHHFSFPDEVRDAVRKHVAKAVSEIDPTRFGGEESYTAALAAKLEGEAYRGPHGAVVFKATVATSKGPGSAEVRSGADLAITADVSDGRKRVRKAILVQAKAGTVDALPAKERRRLEEQIDKMKKVTRSPKVIEYEDDPRGRCPKVVSANRVRSGSSFSRVELGDYFVRRVLTTLDGDTRGGFVRAVQRSDLPGIDVRAVLRS